MKKKYSTFTIYRLLHKKALTFLIVFILLLGFYLRTFSINWDSNYHFHPDERAIIMLTSPLSLPTSWTEFFSENSPLNPHFFAYGTLPIYLLKISSTIASHINPILDEYGGMHIVGRLLSALFDTGTILIVFLLGQKLFSKRTGLFAAFLYSISVLPIQLSHFFAVDTLLTFFISTSIFLLVSFAKNQSIKNIVLLGIFVGASLATKISALILLPVILFTFSFLLIKALRKKHHADALFLVNKFVLMFFLSLLIFVATQPYAVITWNDFLQQTILQSQMSKNPFVFPYTLQYVGKVPYVYELKNIFLWGLGPVIGTLSFMGIITFSYVLYKSKKTLPFCIALFFLLIYFSVFGKFAVGWMRYMLPIYPFFALFAGYFMSEIVIPKLPKTITSSPLKRKSSLLLFALACLLYPLSFLSIYQKPNTRIQATDWIIQNISPGSTIATEHWDDMLPLSNGEAYHQIQLPLYNHDTPEKWEIINAQLQETDYIIIASHRLYVPLQKLTDCRKLPTASCYPLTARYYKELFSEKRGFIKVAEFTSHPKVPFLPIYINDFSADENFTVFDHPKIMIFKKNK